jgi:hypothetical protein
MSDIQVYNESKSVDFFEKKEDVKTHAIAVDTSRAVREVEAALIVAASRPRNEQKAYESIMTSCSRPSLAEKGLFSFDRGGEAIEGETIKLAECMARAYGNLDFGWREVERFPGKSSVEAYCWDLQTNTKERITFDVAHFRDTKRGPKALTNERDIYEHIANHASRRVRKCIISLLPADIVEEAKRKCRETMVKHIGAASGTSKMDYAKKITDSFAELGVTHDMLRKYLGIEKVIAANEQQLAKLRGMYVALKEGHTSIKDLFGDEPNEMVHHGQTGQMTKGNKADDLVERLAGVTGP